MYSPISIECNNPQCNKMFEKYRVQKYCSVGCRNQHAYKRNHKPKGLSLRHCGQCGNPFLMGQGRKQRKYCGDTCVGIAEAERTKRNNRTRKPLDTSKKISEKDGIEWSEPPIGNFIKRKPGKFTKRCSVCTVGITDELNAYYYGDMIVCDDKCFALKHPRTHGNASNKPTPVIDILFPAGYRGHVNGQKNIG